MTSTVQAFMVPTTVLIWCQVYTIVRHRKLTLFKCLYEPRSARKNLDSAGR